jgi:hypothetical protein
MPRRIIWSNPGNPDNRVSNHFRIGRRQLRDALHEIKASNDLSPADRVIIYDDGTVADWNQRDEELGNIFDEL